MLYPRMVISLMTLAESERSDAQSVSGIIPERSERDLAPANTGWAGNIQPTQTTTGK